MQIWPAFVAGPPSAAAPPPSRRTHCRFIAAVTQLGDAEAAVASKVLELMAVEGLTREQVASHLQVRVGLAPAGGGCHAAPCCTHLAHLLPTCCPSCPQTYRDKVKKAMTEDVTQSCAFS